MSLGTFVISSSNFGLTLLLFALLAVALRSLFLELDGER